MALPPWLQAKVDNKDKNGKVDPKAAQKAALMRRMHKKHGKKHHKKGAVPPQFMKGK